MTRHEVLQLFRQTMEEAAESSTSGHPEDMGYAITYAIDNAVLVLDKLGKAGVLGFEVLPRHWR